MAIATNTQMSDDDTSSISMGTVKGGLPQVGALSNSNYDDEPDSPMQAHETQVEGLSPQSNTPYAKLKFEVSDADRKRHS